jgi:hypothetical protein
LPLPWGNFQGNSIKQAILTVPETFASDTLLDCDNLQPDQLYAETIVSAL